VLEIPSNLKPSYSKFFPLFLEHTGTGTIYLPLEMPLPLVAGRPAQHSSATLFYDLLIEERSTTISSPYFPN
jgi:hypothetical protein